MKKVAILGPGLLGGSIALALRARGDTAVAVWARRAEAAAEVLSRGCADLASTDLREVVSGAALVILCTPVGSMPQLATDIAPHLAPGAIVTDVGSVKAPVVAALEPILRGRGEFVGSHPMAGSDQAGIEAARADLFAGAVCIVTPTPSTNAAAAAEVEVFWKSLGSSVRTLSPAEHDEVVALISHFPHLLAATLVDSVASTNPAAFDFAGPGFRDTTRVAGGPPGMWTEILHTNRHAVRKSAEAMVEKLREIIRLLASDFPDQTMHEFLTRAKAQRDRLRLPR